MLSREGRPCAHKLITLGARVPTLPLWLRLTRGEEHKAGTPMVGSHLSCLVHHPGCGSTGGGWTGSPHRPTLSQTSGQEENQKPTPNLVPPAGPPPFTLLACSRGWLTAPGPKCPLQGTSGTQGWGILKKESKALKVTEKQETASSHWQCSAIFLESSSAASAVTDAG